MMNLLQGASDDQVALIGCLVALVGSAALMYVSFYVGPAARQQKQKPEVAIKPLPLRHTDAPQERAA